MSSVEKRVRDGQTTWRAHYRTPAGAQRNKTFTRKGDADRFLATVESAKITGSFADPALARLTVSEWSTRWLEAQAQLKPSTRSRYESVLRKHIVPSLGQREVGQRLARGYPGLGAEACYGPVGVDRPKVASGALPCPRAGRQRWKVDPESGRWHQASPRSTEGPDVPDSCRGPPAGRSVLGNPATAVVKRRDERGSGSDEYRLVVLFLAYTGLRFGEMAALRVRRLNLAARRLEVAESVTAVNGVLVWGTPKGHSRRWVSIPSFIAEQLANHVTGKRGDELVFTSPLGDPLRASKFPTRRLRAGREGRRS